METTTTVQTTAIKYNSYCYNESCPQAVTCVLRRAAIAGLSDEPFVEALNPKSYPKPGESCRYYRVEKKIKAAWGIRKLYDSVPYAEVSTLRDKIIKRLGRSKYYRIYRCEIYLSPEEQQFINSLFSSLGENVKPVYEYYTEEIIW